MAIKTDVIIIGGGPNGLAAGAYLSKAGVKVMVLDFNQELGGGLATEIVTFPGFLINTHSIWHMMVDFAPPYKDFDMEKQYNIKYVWPELQFAMLLADGKNLCLYRDVEKTCKSMAAFSKKDADAYRDLHKKLEAYMDAYLGPLTFVQPMGALEIVPIMERTELGKQFSDESHMSAKEIIDGYFESDQIRAMMYYAACHWGIDYDATGLGFLALLNLNRCTNYRMCVGGSHRLASALQKVILENGGKLRGSQRITKIIVDKGVAKGVELEGGVVIEAEKAVISTIDLDTTFIKYVGEANLEKGFVAAIKGWQWEKWSLLQIHMALHEPPNFKAAAANPDINKALIQMIGYEGTDDVIKHWERIKKGERSTNGFLCSFPSIHDPIQAPAGKCTGLISQMAPYNIKEGPEKWEDYKFKLDLINERYDILQKYAPNMTRDKLIWGYAITPLGTARRFLDMVEGSYKQGAYTNLQMGYLRPNYECSGHRTPIKNLYLGGSNTYPGGMVTFGPGYLAADAVAEDTGIQKWWPECESVTNAKAKGFL